MDLRIFTEPQQGADYDTLLSVAQTAERLGFSGFFRSDHVLKMGSASGLPGPTDAWTTLAGLARDTTDIRLGTLVSPVTFYYPGMLALVVAQVDAMSGGRIDFGFGAGWYEAEHSAAGLPFPGLGERFDRLEEALEQITGLWATEVGDTFSHNGHFHTFADSPALPKPAQRPGPPVIMGGRGPKRTPALVARYASEFNQPFVPVDQIQPTWQAIVTACQAIGRDASELVHSAALVACVGEDDTTFKRRAEAIGREPEELIENGVAGSPAQAAEKLAAYADAGISRFYLQVLDLADLAHLEILAGLA